MTDDARELRRIMGDPLRLVSMLGLTKGALNHGSYVQVRCPACGGGADTPPLSVRRCDDGTVGVLCHSCGFAGDALTLIGKVRDLTSFGEILEHAAGMVGYELKRDDRLPRREGAQERVLVPVGGKGADETKDASESQPEAVARDYPKREEVAQLWRSSGRVDQDPDAMDMLTSRGLSPMRVAEGDFARVIFPDNLPSWARYGGGSWHESGHRVILPVYDNTGKARSVRAWRVTSGHPKRLPPAGCAAGGLVLANRPAYQMLGGLARPSVVLVVEGEPDYLTWATRWEGAVIGVLSGSWNSGFAERIPVGSTVIIRTHCDKAGDKYAAEVLESVRDKCVVRRLQSEG